MTRATADPARNAETDGAAVDLVLDWRNSAHFASTLPVQERATRDYRRKQRSRDGSGTACSTQCRGDDWSVVSQTVCEQLPRSSPLQARLVEGGCWTRKWLAEVGLP